MAARKIVEVWGSQVRTVLGATSTWDDTKKIVHVTPKQLPFSSHNSRSDPSASLVAAIGISCIDSVGMAENGWVLPDTWSEDLKDENGEKMSKRYGAT